MSQSPRKLPDGSMEGRTDLNSQEPSGHGRWPSNNKKVKYLVSVSMYRPDHFKYLLIPQDPNKIKKIEPAFVDTDKWETC